MERTRNRTRLPTKPERIRSGERWWRWRSFSLLVIICHWEIGFFVREQRTRDYVFLRGPVAKIHQTAAIAAERHLRRIQRNFLFANGAAHRGGHTSIIGRHVFERVADSGGRVRQGMTKSPMAEPLIRVVIPIQVI
jgi:hypothetical protein